MMCLENARLVELVDTRDLKSLDLTVVPVQVRQRAPIPWLTDNRYFQKISMIFALLW